MADLERLNHREEQIRRMEAEKLKDEIRAIMQAQNNKTIKPTYQNTRMAQPPVTDVCIQFIGGPKNGEQEFKKNESIYGDGMTIRIIMADNLPNLPHFSEDVSSVSMETFAYRLIQVPPQDAPFLEPHIRLIIAMFVP